MAARRNIIRWENIWIAIIPVLGSIIIAVITLGGHKETKDPIKPGKDLSKLAGEINQMVNYSNYNDLSNHMSFLLKPRITKLVFDKSIHIVDSVVGSFIKPIDTTTDIFQGNKFYIIKNQHLKGQSATVIRFNDDDEIFALFYDPVKQ